MSRKAHKSVGELIDRWAADGKFLTIKEQDERRAGFDQGKPIASDAAEDLVG